MTPDKQQIVYTLTARCRDCHRCLRVCPVNAISMANGQASVQPERCINCGACIRECPQGAKTYRRDIADAQALIASGAQVAVSLAPSFAAAFPGWQAGRLISALRRLGFSLVAETAVGAYYAAGACSGAARCGQSICSACPAAVNYIEKYKPELAQAVMSVASPMIVHGRMLKKRMGPGSKVVFIGPCIAKKSELDRPDVADAVDVVLTFEELGEWMSKSGIELASCEESAFDDCPRGEARLYPVAGGFLKAAGLESGLVSQETLSVTGPAAVKEALQSLSDGWKAVLEPLFCRDGCINGPGLKSSSGALERRSLVIAYASKSAAADPHAAMREGKPGAAENSRTSPPPVSSREKTTEATSEGRPSREGTHSTASGGPTGQKQQEGGVEKGVPAASCSCVPDEAGMAEGELRALCAASFAPREFKSRAGFSEEEIQRVLEKTGKGAKEDQLNCGACGYNSCREKAIAVLEGMAVPEMCIPLMRRRAEQRTDSIISTSPNGIVVLNAGLEIISMNPAFRSLFSCTDDLLGRRISYLIDADPFEKVAAGVEEQIDAVFRHRKYGVVCRQMIYSMKEEGQIVGIFINMTAPLDARKRIEELRGQTVAQANELLAHQIHMAQEMARYLGESTAKGEELVKKLISLADEQNDTPGRQV